MTENMIDITPIIECVLSLILTIISVIAIPKFNTWIKNHLTANQIDIAKIIITSAVEAAEQIYAHSEHSGASKKNFVMDYAKKKLAEIGLTFNDKDIEVYLEQAVKQMNDNKATGQIDLDDIYPEGSI